MIAIAHLISVLCYIGAAVLAATPFVRPVPPPVRSVTVALGAGVAVHLIALVLLSRELGQLPLTGLGPALSFAGFNLALILLVAEVLATEVSLTLVAAPLAAISTSSALAVGFSPALEPGGVQGTWLNAHIALSFLGIAAFATSAAAGATYLIERHELRTRRFGAVFRFFPPLQTLDRVNHLAAVAGWIVLTVGVVLAIGYSVAYREWSTVKIIWALLAWLAVSTLALGRIVGGWQARRAAIVSSISFSAVLVLYVAFRMASTASRGFL